MILEDDRFELTLAEVATGVVLNARGEPLSRGTPPFQPTFATRDAALATKDDLLRRFPFAEVWLRDRAGEHEPERFIDEAGFAEDRAVMVAWCKWRASWFRRLLRPEPPNPRRTSK